MKKGKKRFLLTGLVLLFVNLGISFLSPQKAYAYTTFKWTDGSTLVPDGSGKLSGSLRVSVLDTTLVGELRVTDRNCAFNASIVLNGNAGTLRASRKNSISTPGTPTTGECEEEVWGAYNGEEVRISNPRPAGEGDAAKTVTIIANIPKIEKPASINLTIKNAAGTTVFSASPRLQDNGENNKSYIATTKLGPGRYTACADNDLGCVEFEKKERIPLLAIKLGEAVASRKITINYSETVSGNVIKLDSRPITLYTEDKKTVVKTGETESITLTNIDIDTGGTITSKTIPTSGVLDDVAPGKYVICVNTTVCKPVEKIKGVALTVDLEGDFTDDEVTATASTDTSDRCIDSSETISPLKWIVCPVAALISDAIDKINDGIEALLQFNPTDGGSCAPTAGGSCSLRDVWGRILNIANVLFVIAFLIMVLSTALNLGLFSNYTVKKLLPRIVIAAIIANLSWGVASVLIAVTNIMGEAAKDVILGPLGLPETGAVFNSALNADGSGIIQTAVVGGIGALIYFSIASAGAILLPVLAIAFIAVLVALIALLLRRIIIIVLIIAAPLAFAMWALPGGEKWLQRWWKLFIEMLLMYPMIMALFASGVFVSKLITSSSGSAGLGITTSAMALIALVLPYFMIPVLFKVASGTLANLTGMINDRGKGLIDRSRNWRDKNSQWGRRKELKAQRKNFTGHEKLLESMDAEKLMGSEWLQRRRRAQGLGREWKRGPFKQGELAQQTQRTFLAKTKAAVSRENLEAASYTVRAAGGGIDARRRDGEGKLFRVTRAGEKTPMWLSKDAAVAEGLRGARVESMEEEYDRSGRFTGYSNKVNGVLGDGSESSQRAFAGVAGVQALAPVIEAARFGTQTRVVDPATGQTSLQDWSGWKLHNQDGSVVRDASGNSVMHVMDGFGEAYSTAVSSNNEEAKHAAQVAGMVVTEAKDTYAQNFKDKLPSWITGENLAFTGVNANKVSSMHENDMRRNFEFLDKKQNGERDSQNRVILNPDGTPRGQDQATAREAAVALGQSMVDIIHEPSKFGGRSPKTMQQVYIGYQRMLRNGTSSYLTPEMRDAFEKVRSDGTLNL